jgi:hypothetical protein
MWELARGSRSYYYLLFAHAEEEEEEAWEARFRNTSRRVPGRNVHITQPDTYSIALCSIDVLILRIRTYHEKETLYEDNICIRFTLNRRLGRR